MEEAPDEGLESCRPDLERIHSAGRKLLALVNDLFDPSKTEVYKANPSLLDHELRTPLNQIIGYAEMLQEESKALGRERPAADLEKIHLAARQLLEKVTENFPAPGPEANWPAMSASGGTGFARRDAHPLQPFSPSTLQQPQTGAILVADDDLANREMLSRRLSRLGYKVAVAENGAQAIEHLRREPFDVLLLDIQMPVLNGYDALQQLKADPALRDVPVVVLSASSETDRIAQCIELGAEDYLPKPFDPILLQARISACLEKKRLRDREVLHLRQIEEEKRRSDELLHIILPQDVAAELKANGRVKPRRFDNVAVLFCDIVEFTSYCDRHSAEEVLGHLQVLVETLERLTARHGLEKIKTVGDAFIATSGLPVPLPDPAMTCVRCGLEMISAVREFPAGWRIRMGIHVGPVMAGIVGHRKYQYDIWGDTVNTAARMEQAAAPNSICVTAETWQLLASHCEGESMGRVAVKGKGEFELFRVTRIRGTQ